MPFLTEALWHRLPQRAGARSIALEAFPVPDPAWASTAAERDVALLQEIIVAARNIRAELKLDPRQTVPAEFSAAPEVRKLVESHLQPVLRLGTLSALNFASGRLDAATGGVRSTAQFDLRIPYGKPADVNAELARLRREKERLEEDVRSKKSQLADDAFRRRAPAQVVRSLEDTLEERQVEYQKLLERLVALERVADG
jgi:valyl-tRNA synthetase